MIQTDSGWAFIITNIDLQDYRWTTHDIKLQKNTTQGISIRQIALLDKKDST